MTIENFDYKKLAEDLSEQASKLLPMDISKKDREYIIEIIYNFVFMSGEALVTDDTIDYKENEAIFICQTITEWTFHRGVDLAHSDISKDYWEPILNKLAFVIFEITKKCINTNVPLEEMLAIVEKQADKSWKDSLEELSKQRELSETIKKTKKISNFDVTAEKADIVDEKVEFLENIYQSVPANKKISNLKKIKISLIYYYKIVNNKFIDFIDNTKSYFQNSVIVGILLCISIVLYNVLDNINILSIIAENKEFMYILWTVSLIFVAVYAWNKLITKRAMNKELKQLEDIRQEMEELVNPDRMYDRLEVDAVSITVGTGLLRIADPDQDDELMPKILALRQKLTDELGYIIPEVRIMESYGVEPNEYVISIRNNVVASGYVYPKKYMVIADQWDSAVDEIPDDTIIGVDPTYNTQVYWINEFDAKRHKKITAVSPVDVVLTHLRHELIKHVDNILTISDVLKLIDYVNNKEPKLYKDIKEHEVTEHDLRKIFVNLIREEVSIKDILFVFERISDFSRFSKEPDVLSERIRIALNRQICLKNVKDGNVLYVLTLSPEWEKTLDASYQSAKLGSMFLLGPMQVQTLVEATKAALMKANQQIGEKPVILCPPKIRLPLYQLLVRDIHTIVVLSYSEIITDIKVESVDVIGEELN